MSNQFNLQPQDDDLQWQQEDAQAESEASPALDENAGRRARLQASATQELQPLRMRMVDQLLESAPMAAPRAGFADRVLAMLKERTPYVLRPSAGLGLALGLSVSAGFAIFLVILALLLVTLIALNWSWVYRNVARAIGEISTAVGSVLDALGSVLGDATPFVLFILILGIPLIFLWVRIVRRQKVSKSEG